MRTSRMSKAGPVHRAALYMPAMVALYKTAWVRRSGAAGRKRKASEGDNRRDDAQACSGGVRGLMSGKESDASRHEMLPE
jgi:hypothetical protein